MVRYATACYYSLFGERGPAIEMLERAIDAGFANFPYLEQDPDLRPLHGEAAYKELMRRHGRARRVKAQWTDQPCQRLKPKIWEARAPIAR